MNTTKKYILLSLLGALVLVIIISIGADYYIENKIETTVKEELSEDFSIEDFQLDVNSRSGSVYIESISIQKKNEPSTHLHLVEFELIGLSIYELVFNNNIIIDNLNIQKLQLSVEEESELLQKKESSKKSESSNFNIEHIELKNINIESLNIEMLSSASNTTSLKVEDMNLEVAHLKLNQKQNTNQLPFWFDRFSLTQGKLTYMLGEYNELAVKEIEYAQQNIEVNDLSIHTIYDEKEFSKIIKVEKDHYKVDIPTIKLVNFEAKKENKDMHIASSKLIIHQPNLEVYRDKQVKKDTTFKALFSKKIRELPFKMTIDSAQINDAKITYEEKVLEDKAPEKISLEQLNAAITNLSNTYPPEAKKTNIKVNSIFMKETQLDADWSFDVNSETDEFFFQAELGNLDADSFNNFTENSLRVLLEGELEKTYLNIQGNNESSTTNMNLTYDNFKVSLLTKKGNKKDILSEIVNFFVSDDNKNEAENQDLKGKAKRVKNKSFFNFLWVSIKSALKDLI